LLTLGKFHGAAVQDSMEAIQRVVKLAETATETETLADIADRVVVEWRQAGRRLSGFGHRQHKRQDPRLARLFGLAQEAEVSGRYLAASQAIEMALKQVLGKELPINIDGAMAAILLEVGFPPGLANALFMVARFTGILAHAQEEQERMPPMRRVDPVDHGYSGPKQRKLSTE
jgi:citrate synthase